MNINKNFKKELINLFKKFNQISEIIIKGIDKMIYIA